MTLFGRPTPQDDLKAQAYAHWIAQRNPLAIISLVLGIFSLIDFGVLWLPEIAGIVLGVISLNQLSKIDPTLPNAKPLGHRLAWAGILLSAISLVIAILLYLQRRGRP